MNEKTKPEEQINTNDLNELMKIQTDYIEMQWDPFEHSFIVTTKNQTIKNK